MRERKLQILSLFFALLFSYLPAQVQQKSLDSLHEMSYQQLKDLIYEVKDTNPDLATDYAGVYLQKAKDENNILEQAKGYRYFAVVNHTGYEHGMAYIDSAIAIGGALKDKKYPALLYVHKGILFEEKADFKQSLNNYLIGLDIVKSRKNKLLENAIHHNIALIKRKFGHYEEAKSLFKTILKYDSERYNRKEIEKYNYHLSLFELIHSYRLNNQIDSAYVLNEKGISESVGEIHAPYFVLSRGMLEYHKLNYHAAIKDLNEVLPLMIGSKPVLYFDKLNVISAFLYLGKSYEALDRRDVALRYYKKIDSIAEHTNYVLPETNTAYFALKKYYNDIGDKGMEISYIDKLLRSDSILNDNYTYLRKKLKKEYDTPRLMEEKEALIQELESKKKISYWRFFIMLFFLLIISSIAILNYRKQRLYKERFQKLINKKVVGYKVEESIETPEKVEEGIGISQDIIEKVLDEMKKFEENNEFLKPNLTTTVLARKLKTNAKYLSKIINHYKEKNFTQYINDLRIGFIIEELKKNSKYRNFTIKALAIEAGFSSAEVFSKSFYKNTGIYPSYFIKQIEKSSVK